MSFIVLFVLSFVLINDKSKPTTGEIKAYAEYMIILEWDDKSKNDLDLWVKGPNGRLIGFRNPDDGSIFLDRDDVGLSNDYYYDESGSVKNILINREVITIRGIFPGRYVVNVHAFNLTKNEVYAPENCRVSIIKINPYRIVAKNEMVFEFSSEEQTAFSFEIYDDGSISNFGVGYEPLVNR